MIDCEKIEKFEKGQELYLIGNFHFIENTINRLNEFFNDDNYDEYVDYDADNFGRIKSRKETLGEKIVKRMINMF